jgi:hypothetical protein
MGIKTHNQMVIDLSRLKVLHLVVPTAGFHVCQLRAKLLHCGDRFAAHSPLPE